MPIYLRLFHFQPTNQGRILFFSFCDANTTGLIAQPFHQTFKSYTSKAFRRLKLQQFKYLSGVFKTQYCLNRIRTKKKKKMSFRVRL